MLKYVFCYSIIFCFYFTELSLIHVWPYQPLNSLLQYSLSTIHNKLVDAISTIQKYDLFIKSFISFYVYNEDVQESLLVVLLCAFCDKV